MSAARYIIMDGTGAEYIASRDQLRTLAARWRDAGARMERRASSGTICQSFGSTMRASYVHVTIGKGSADIFRAI